MKPAPQLDLHPLNANVSIVDRAYIALKGAIVDADIYGQREEIRLDERQLSLALGVSRTPIREAMTLLEQEGFLRTVPRRGIFIVRKTKKEIVERLRGPGLQRSEPPGAPAGESVAVSVTSSPVSASA